MCHSLGICGDEVVFIVREVYVTGLEGCKDRFYEREGFLWGAMLDQYLFMSSFLSMLAQNKKEKE